MAEEIKKDGKEAKEKETNKTEGTTTKAKKTITKKTEGTKKATTKTAATKKTTTKSESAKKAEPKKETTSKEKVEVKAETKQDELKKEAANTVNQVKDSFKNVDIKKESIETKGFIVDMFKNPLKKIQQIADKDTSKYFTHSIIILVIWVVARILLKMFSYKYIIGEFSFRHMIRISEIGNALLSIIISGITPILSILAMSLIIYWVNKKNKKQLTTILTLVISASIPVVIASVVSLLTIFGVKVSIITSPFVSLCNVISIILTYFVAKAILGVEKDSDFIKKFILIETIFYIVYIVFSFFEIYI